jgi:small subunit ribosomal protein S8
LEIARILKEEGYIKDYQLITENNHQMIRVFLKYGDKKRPVIAGLKRISKPGLRVYAGANEIPKVLGGLGTAIISTSKGVMTDRDARKLNVGGEVLCFIW